MNTWRKYFTVCCWSFVIISFTVVSGCGYAWRTQKPIHNERSNIDAPVSTMTYPDRVKSEIVYFNHEGTEGELVVTLTREAELFDRKIDTVDRQIYQKSGYGKQHKQWPIWVDAITAPVLAIGGGTALALGASQDTENDIEYRDNPDTGEREQKESPNSSDQDTFYTAGGIGIGVSIPFIVSAIHNGVKTKDRNIGAPVRTNLETKINMRTTTTPLAGTPVEIKLPDGTEIAATSDDKGRVNISLPDTQDSYFPLRQIVVVRVPSKVALYNIPINARTIALLPPAARARADELAEAVRAAQNKLDAAKAEIAVRVEPLRQDYFALTPNYETYWVRGKIQDWDDNKLTMLGTARGYRLGEGYAPEKTLLIVHDYNTHKAQVSGYTSYDGEHVFLRKTSGVNFYGNSIPVREYGSEPEEKGAVVVARKRWERAKDKYRPRQLKAEQELNAVRGQYNMMLPTDPYRLKPVEEMKGQ